MTTIEKIFSLMEEKSVTAYRLSKECKITESLFSNWKNGLQKPKLDALVKIADYFNVTLDYLCGRTSISNDLPDFPADFINDWQMLTPKHRKSVANYAKTLLEESAKMANQLADNVEEYLEQ